MSKKRGGAGTNENLRPDIEGPYTGYGPFPAAGGGDIQKRNIQMAYIRMPAKNVVQMVVPNQVEKRMMRVKDTTAAEICSFDGATAAAAMSAAEIPSRRMTLLFSSDGSIHLVSAVDASAAALVTTAGRVGTAPAPSRALRLGVGVAMLVRTARRARGVTAEAELRTRQARDSWAIAMRERRCAAMIISRGTSRSPVRNRALPYCHSDEPVTHPRWSPDRPGLHHFRASTCLHSTPSVLSHFLTAKPSTHFGLAPPCLPPLLLARSLAARPPHRAAVPLCPAPPPPPPPIHASRTEPGSGAAVAAASLSHRSLAKPPPHRRCSRGDSGHSPSTTTIKKR